MRPVFFIISLTFLSFQACTDRPKTPPPQSNSPASQSNNPPNQSNNPIEAYGNGLIGAQTRAKNTAVATNLDTVQKTVQAYRAANDRYPDSLNDIAGMINRAVDLTIYDYDPSTGTVRLK